MNGISLIFNHNPSAPNTILKAFRNRKNTFTPGREYPIITAARPGFIVDDAHIMVFNEICEISRSECLHILYPFTLAYPYILRVLCSHESPVSLFKVLNTRNSIVMHRRIRPDERLDIDCRNTAPRIVQKGLELDIISIVSSGGKRVWENTTTYFFPGKFGPADASFRTPKLEPINGNPEIKEWYFPAKDRFRFARISGDGNGIHYGFYYARMMGFKRDFAQPIRVVARCVSSIADEPDAPARLDFNLKGPIYYENRLALKYIHTPDGTRFDLYCGSEERPGICGILQTLSG
jgi:hypothetical protein